MEAQQKLLGADHFAVGGLGVNPQGSAILAEPRVLERMAEISIGLKNASLKLGHRAPACASPPAPERRSGDTALVAKIVRVGGEAKARDTSRQQAIEEIGPGRGEEKAPRHTPG